MDKEIKRIATIQTPFAEKFGIPRQSGLVPSVTAEIHFEEPYRSVDAVRGIEEFSHLWLIWGFSKNRQKNASLTVAPPRLGGRQRLGVFATRSPFRPNGMGLSSVRLEHVRIEEDGAPVLLVSGADLLDGTPIYDIKPYLPYTDSHPDADGGFGEAHKMDRIRVDFPDHLLGLLPGKLRQCVCDVLAQDPRAAYQKQPDSVFGMNFAGYDIRFVAEVIDGQDCLRVVDIVNAAEGKIK